MADCELPVGVGNDPCIFYMTSIPVAFTVPVTSNKVREWYPVLKKNSCLATSGVRRRQSWILCTVAHTQSAGFVEMICNCNPHIVRNKPETLRPSVWVCFVFVFCTLLVFLHKNMRLKSWRFIVCIHVDVLWKSWEVQPPEHNIVLHVICYNYGLDSFYNIKCIERTKTIKRHHSLEELPLTRSTCLHTVSEDDDDAHTEKLSASVSTVDNVYLLVQ